jgi:4-cresol dehydrogenase (hydroxylating)
MNRILDFDDTLGYVTIEPGVTQQQLFDFLQARGGRFWMDATGASPECSVIGNTMERGFGHTPMGDHCGNACALEVVLASGEIVETGFARFAAARTKPLGRWGLGPSLDGLFSQSNLGIVTRLSVWLMPAPEAFQAFFFTCAGEHDLGPVIDALRPLRMDGTLRSVMHIGNDYKVVAASGRYPWDLAGGRTPLGPTEMATLRARLGIGRWSGSGGLYGTAAQVKDAKRRLRRALEGKVSRLQFVDDRVIGLLRRFPRAIGSMMRMDVAKTLAVLEPVYSLLKGAPTRATLASAYWRKRMEPPADPDPDRDRCGLLWCSPVMPNTGAAARDVTDVAARVLLDSGFEPQMSISVASERLLACIITIGYDRDVEGEDARAAGCFERLLQEMLARGYPPYRLPVTAMADVDAADSGFARTVKAIKRALDPDGILAPGRYTSA